MKKKTPLSVINTLIDEAIKNGQNYQDLTIIHKFIIKQASTSPIDARKCPHPYNLSSN